jgi:TolB-like protein/lipoprotein NlpI
MEGKRQLAAIMFTDLEGFSALAQQDESLSIRILDKHRELIRPILGEHEGREIKTMGDAFLVEFASALDAVECAVHLQEVLRKYNLDAAEKILVRAGIHVGDVIHREGDVYGDAVNIASRIEPLARGGEVCISEQVYAQVRNKTPYRYVLLEPQYMKNISVPIGVYRVELPREAAPKLPDQREGQRIAVLPLVNLSHDQSDEYLADAMTEELISTISKAKSLRVIARTSVMHYRGSSMGISEIARNLNVSSVLAGSVQKAGNKLRVSVQLIDAKTEEYLWTDKYDREMDNIFAIQDDIAHRVSNALKVKLVKGEAKGTPTEDIGAYTHYLRGRRLLYDRSEHSIKAAMEQFESAIKLDPKYAAAYAGLADAYYLSGYYRFSPLADSYGKAKELTSRALALNEGLAEAHATVGVIRDHYDYDFPGAEASFQRAIDLNPSYAQAHHWYAVTLMNMGRLEEALTELDRASEADPLSSIIRVIRGNALYFIGREAAALDEWRTVQQNDPTFPGLYWQRAFYFADTLQEKEATGEMKKLAGLSHQGDKGLLFLEGYLDARFGRREDALRIAEDLESTEQLPQFVAHICAALGDSNGFFLWADKALRSKSFEVLAVRYMRIYEAIRNDQRYVELLNNMGLQRRADSTVG